MRKRQSVFLMGLALLLAGVSPVRAETIFIYSTFDTYDLMAAIANIYYAEARQGVMLDDGNEALLLARAKAGTTDLIAAQNQDFLLQLDRGGLLVSDTRTLFAIDPLVLVSTVSPEIKPADLNTPIPVSDISVAGDLAIVSSDTLLAKQTQDAISAFAFDDEAEQGLKKQSSAGAVLQMVKNGGVKFGIVHETDMFRDPNLVIVAYFPSASYQPTGYGVALIAKLNRNNDASAFYRYLTSNAIADTLKPYGLIPGNSAIAVSSQ